MASTTHDEKYEDALPRLMAAHPLLFAGEFEIPSELPGGWHAIADRLCADLETILGEQASRFQPIQSKEKWGSWRFYWRLELDDDGKPNAFNIDLTSPPDPAGAEDLIQGDVQVSPTPAGYRIWVLPQGDVRRAVHARVRQAETATETACMRCGEPGTYWSNGWVHVACQKHRRQEAMTLDEWRRRAEARRQKYERGRDPGKRKNQKDGDE